MELFKKFIRILKSRPYHIPAHIRAIFLFYAVYAFRKLKIIQFPGITFGKNVRLQTFFGAKAELPNANIEFHDHCVIYENAKIEAYGNGKIIIGEKTILGDVRIYSRKKITLGKRILVSWNVMIQDFNPHPVRREARQLQVEQIMNTFIPKFEINDINLDTNSANKYKLMLQNSPNEVFSSDEINIGDDVWLGANCAVLKGANIGNGCIVSAGTIVLKGTYPDNSIIIGNPGVVVKTIS